MFELPKDYIEEISGIFGAETETYQRLFSQEPYRGLSINRLKASPEKLLPLLPFEIKKSPFYRDGYYIMEDVQGLGRHPLHQAGAFYVQEPSAASAVTLLDVQKGDKVLDLCAAPGGKSAQIASCLEGTGLLWSNEVVRNRAQILLSNFERMGIAEGVVSSCYPETLCDTFSGFFDKVLVDAPCSGEGMFRKNPEAVSEWSREHVRACAERQLSILHSAARAVRAGGILVYSTCTFSREENENVVQKFLSEHEEFEPVNVQEPFGRASAVPCGVRITPMDGGEGHFAAKLRRKSGEDADSPALYFSAAKQKPDPLLRTIQQELSAVLKEFPQERLRLMNDRILILPSLYPAVTVSGILRAGVLAGEWRRNRFEPSHALFMSQSPQNFHRVLSLSPDDKRIGDFLRGLEIDCDTVSGYTAAAVSGYVLGFGKCSGGRLKNKYPKGLRLT